MRAAVGVGIALVAWVAAAQPASRTEYAVRTLRDSSSFRVRAQAALTLGTVPRERAVIDALRGALTDSSPVVRMAAASSLERQRDPSALPALRRLLQDTDPGVRRAVLRAVDVLESLPPPPPSDESARNARYYVSAATPTSNVGSLSTDQLRTLNSFVREQLSAMAEVVLARDGENSQAASQVLSARGLRGYAIQISVTSLGEGNGGLRAVVSVLVLTYPGQELRAMLQGAATVRGSSGERAEQYALQGAVRSALRNLLQAMEAASR